MKCIEDTRAKFHALQNPPARSSSGILVPPAATRHWFQLPPARPALVAYLICLRWFVAFVACLGCNFGVFALASCFGCILTLHFDVVHIFMHILSHNRFGSACSLAQKIALVVIPCIRVPNGPFLQEPRQREDAHSLACVGSGDCSWPWARALLDKGTMKGICYCFCC